MLILLVPDRTGSEIGVKFLHVATGLLQMIFISNFVNKSKRSTFSDIKRIYMFLITPVPGVFLITRNENYVFNLLFCVVYASTLDFLEHS